jgi:hypothetical protein
MALVSEDIRALTPERYQLLERSFPLNPTPAQWVDWYEDAELCILKSEGDPVTIGLFNVSDEPRDLTIPAKKLGLGNSWRFTERITAEQFQGSGECVHFPQLPPHSGRLWRLSE